MRPANRTPKYDFRHNGNLITPKEFYAPLEEGILFISGDSGGSAEQIIRGIINALEGDKKEVLIISASKHPLPIAPPNTFTRQISFPDFYKEENEASYIDFSEFIANIEKDSPHIVIIEEAKTKAQVAVAAALALNGIFVIAQRKFVFEDFTAASYLNYSFKDNELLQFYFEKEGATGWLNLPVETHLLKRSIHVNRLSAPNYNCYSLDIWNQEENNASRD